MKLPKISVIMPVYNTAKFLNKSINSVLNQTYPNIELVIINDGSTDKSDCVIQSFLKENKNIVYLKNEKNVGSLESRLSAFRCSTGDYIAFLDSDDSMSKDFLRKMLSTIQKENADICLADWIYEYEDGRKQFLPYEEIRLLDINNNNKQIVDKFSKGHGRDFSWHVLWNKMLTRDLMEKSYSYLEEFSQNTGKLVMCEDIAYSFTFYLLANKVVNCHNVHYNYFQHGKQSVKITSKEKYKSNLFDVIRVFDYIFDFFKKQKLFEKYKSDLQSWKNTYFSTYYNMAQELNYTKIFKELTKEEKFEIVKNDDLTLEKYDFGKEYEKYEKIIDAITSNSTKVVSFDIFDTLLLRKTYNPTDVFDIMNSELKDTLKNIKCDNFKSMRVDAENKALEHFKWGEVTFDEIYNYFITNYNLSKEIVEELKTKEIKYELKLSLPRKTAKDLYDIAALNDKKIVYTTDMYLPKDVILKLLKQSGYSTENELFLSCEKKKSKHSGELFKLVIQKTKSSPNEIVHIGDNETSDVLMANRSGIKGFLLPSVKQMFDNCKFNHITLNDKKIDENKTSMIKERTLLASLSNNIYDFPFVSFHCPINKIIESNVNFDKKTFSCFKFNDSKLIKPRKKGKLKKIADFLLPPGTKRRGFTKRFINLIAPKDSKRRMLMRKLFLK